MKPEQKMGAVFAAVGIVMGIVSALLRGTLIAAIILPIVAYVVMIFASKRIESSKNMKWAVMSSLPSFFLTWIVSWIFVFNLG